MSNNKKRSFLDQIGDYVNNNSNKVPRIEHDEGSKTVHPQIQDIEDESAWLEVLNALNEDDDEPQFQDECGNWSNFDLLLYLETTYPDYANARQEFHDIHKEWLTRRPDANKTPIRYHKQHTIINQLEELCDICLYNTAVIKRFIGYYEKKKLHTSTDSINVISLKSDLKNLNDSIIVAKRMVEELSVESENYQDDVDIIISKMDNITNHIFEILEEYQYTMIDPVVNKIRSDAKIKLDIPYFAFSDTYGGFSDTGEILIRGTGDHILILSIVSHGCHHTNMSYPTFLAIPDNTQICKTTIALPGETLFSLGEHRGFLRDVYGEYIYNDGTVHMGLNCDFTETFTTVNEFMKYPILLEINRVGRCIDPSIQHVDPDFRKWCDGVLNSTNKLMVHTRHGRYIKNKEFSLNKVESGNIVEYGISVLYDSSGLFQTGDQLIDVASTFTEGVKSASITLQELLNDLNKLGIWNKYGFTDSSCENGNICLSHDLVNYKNLHVVTWRGGRMEKKRRYTKRKKYTKKRMYIKKKCTRRKKYNI